MSGTIVQATLTEAVDAVDGVVRVAANETTKRVDVAFDPSRASLARIEAALDDAGYPARKYATTGGVWSVIVGGAGRARPATRRRPDCTRPRRA